MSIDDDRVRFYLRHREQIEQWAALRSEAASAIDEWLLALRGDVEELVAELGPDVTVCVRHTTDNAWPGFLLFRRAWSVKDATNPQPSVGLEWGRASTTLRGTAAPYVGLRSFRDTELGAAFRGRADLKRVRAERRDATGPNWVAYGYVLPSEPFPENEAGYRALLLEALRDAWRAYAPFVDDSTAMGG